MKEEKKTSDMVLHYRANSIIATDVLMVIVSIISLCSPNPLNYFVKAMFFTTIMTIVFEHKYIETWYLKFKARKKPLGKLFNTMKLISTISFTLGMYYMLFG